MKVAATNRLYNIDGKTLVNKAYVGSDLVWFLEPIRVWDAYFDDSFWDPRYGSWDAINQEWDSGDYNTLWCSVKGIWNLGIRPTKCRVTASSASLGYGTFYDTADNILGWFYEFPDVSVATANLTFTSYDIAAFGIGTYTSSPYSVINIEFFH
jgi:hypothetical protein